MTSTPINDEEISKSDFVLTSDPSKIVPLGKSLPPISIVPNVTVVTANYCFHNSSSLNGLRTRQECIDAMDPLLRMPINLVVFTSPDLYHDLREHRTNAMKESFPNSPTWTIDNTVWIVAEWESFPFVKHVRPIIVSNRENYFPTKDSRVDENCHLLQLMKGEFIRHVIQGNPFGSKVYAWCDAHLLAQKQDPNTLGRPYKILSRCRHPTNFQEFRSTMIQVLENAANPMYEHLFKGFRCQLLNVQNTTKFSQEEHKREFYGQFRYIMCGSFFTVGSHGEDGIHVLDKLLDVIAQTTKLGFGHSEEPLFVDILDNPQVDPEFITSSYGDYCHLLDNFFHPKPSSFEYIHRYIFAKYCDVQLEQNPMKAIHCLLSMFRTRPISLVELKDHAKMLSSPSSQPTPLTQLLEPINRMKDGFKNTNDIFTVLKQFQAHLVNFQKTCNKRIYDADWERDRYVGEMSIGEARACILLIQQIRKELIEWIELFYGNVLTVVRLVRSLWVDLKFDFQTTKYGFVLNDLEDICLQIDEPVEGNCVSLHMDIRNRPEDLETKQRNLFELAMESQEILEIGFNAGHSCFFFLIANETSKIEVCDLNRWKYTMPCYLYMKEVFGAHRFGDMLIEGASSVAIPTHLAYNPKNLRRFDLIHIDGGHDPIHLLCDIYFTYNMAKSFVVVDDTQMSHIRDIFSNVCNEKRLFTDVTSHFRSMTGVSYSHGIGKV